ncbi:recombination protein O N-terminal domain-containing protein [Candidatus Kaiserbacteria bacterium]|nr:recombination protein O N-terminal domain-containing protein [Candidatus Kaiserbacteria bacterium]
MAYQTYITDALVCASCDRNTADRAYLLFTREAGMVWANARSVREERSKQRFALQDLSYARSTLVHGKTGWRVAGVEPIQNFYYTAPSREVRAFLKKSVRLLRRVMHGDTPHPTLFDRTIAACRESDTLDPKDLELIFSLGALAELGYVDPTATIVPLLPPAALADAVGELTDATRTECEKVIASGLAHSQL